MALSQRLDLRQSQSLVMTPQLQQAIKLLQFSNAELTEFVERELEKNPLLENDEGEQSYAEEASQDNVSAYENAQDAEVKSMGNEEGFSDEIIRDTLLQTSSENLPSFSDDPNDTDYDNNWASAGINEATEIRTDTSAENFSSHKTSGASSNFDNSDYNIDETASADKTLRQHLYEQLGVDFTNIQDRLIGSHLIEMIDDTGYLSTDPSDVMENLDCTEEQVNEVLDKLQHFDPPGIFARDLSECLALQLRDRNRLDPAMQKLLENLDQLAKHDLNNLKKLCGVDDEDIIEMISEIKSLNPKPGLLFEPSIDQQIAPDVLLRASPDGTWLVELNPETLPKVLVNNSYYAKVSKKQMLKPEKEYLHECIQSANWLVKSLHQRATTIIKVASEIVSQQDNFFRFGVQYLKPLVLRDVAAAIDMHESTVSRVTNNKYISTPRGMLELKYFFSSSIASAAGGDAHSAEAVKAKIKALVDSEESNKILSDDRIVEILVGQGVDIARRTVAKYRDAMRIPSSVQRRRQKSIKI